MERELRRVHVAVVSLHLRDGAGVTGAERLEQLLALPFGLLEVRLFSNRASGRDSAGHDELLSWLRRSRSWRARCPLARAEKSSSIQRRGNRSGQVDAVLPADTAAPCSATDSIPRGWWAVKGDS